MQERFWAKPFVSRLTQERHQSALERRVIVGGVFVGGDLQFKSRSLLFRKSERPSVPLRETKLQATFLETPIATKPFIHTMRPIPICEHRLPILAFAAALSLHIAPVHATLLWDESASGDLPEDPAGPTGF